MNEELWLSVAEQRTKEHFQAVELYRTAGGGQKASLAQHTGRMLKGVGVQLVEWGRQLEGYTAPPLALHEDQEMVGDLKIA